MNLNRGINLGGYLSQCVHTKEHYESFIHEADIKKIADAGFDHIRVPIDYEVFETEAGADIEYGYGLVDRLLGWAKKNGLEVILDLHKAYGYDFNDAGCKEKNNLFDDEALKQRFVGLWSKISKRYGNEKNVAFELLNEVVEEENANGWNELIKRAVAAIRENAPDSYIIYGGIMWNSIRKLKLLEAPIDDRIIFTFHFYEPLLFTHQKAHWMPTMDKNLTINYPDDIEVYTRYASNAGIQGEVVKEYTGSRMDINFMREIITNGISDVKKLGVRIYCGEFGVIDQAPAPDTLRWYQDIMMVFRENKIGCSLWTYKQMDFGIYGEHYAEIFDGITEALK